MKRWQSYREAHDSYSRSAIQLGPLRCSIKTISKWNNRRNFRVRRPIEVAKPVRIHNIDTQSGTQTLSRISLAFPSSGRLFPVVQTSPFTKTARLDRYARRSECLPRFFNPHVIPYNYPFFTRFKITKLLLFEMGFQIQSIDLRFKFQEGGSLFVEDSSISWEKKLG